MKHAGTVALDSIAVLLSEVGSRAELTEKKPGIFYCKSKAFLHFHEDPAGLFADLKTARGFERLPVNTPEEHEELLARIAALLGRSSPVGS
jgi:hypothetical protein